MSDPDLHRTAKVTAYRARAGAPGGFVSTNPAFFQTLPNGLEVTQLRIQAQVEKHVDKEPNTCKIKIYNCSEQTRAFLEAKPLTIRLDAGYNGILKYVFTGDLRIGYTEFSGATAITHLELADGDRAYRYAQVTKTYGRGTRLIQAVKDAAASMGLGLSATILNNPDLQVQLSAGRTVDGYTRDELTTLLQDYGYRWSIQEGKLTILRDGQLKDNEAILISQDTGMINSPTFITPEKPTKPIMVKVESKLRAEVIAHSKIVVRSRGIASRTFSCQKIEHNLDTRSGPWDSKIEGVAV